MAKQSAATARVKTPTDLQRRLAAEVKAGLDRTGKTAADLSRDTDLSPPYISQLLSFAKPGTIEAWDLLLRAVGVTGYRSPDGTIVPVPPKPKERHELGVTEFTVTADAEFQAALDRLPPVPPQHVTVGPGGSGYSGVQPQQPGGGGAGGRVPQAVTFTPPSANPAPMPPKRRPAPPPPPGDDEDFAPRRKDF